MEERVVLRPRRQLTLPRSVCDALGVQPGDRLVLELVDGKLVVEPQRIRAMEALRALRRAIAESGVSEEEMLEGAREVREELFRERYGYLLEKRTRGTGRRRRSA